MIFVFYSGLNQRRRLSSTLLSKSSRFDNEENWPPKYLSTAYTDFEIRHVIYPPRNPRQFPCPFKQAFALFSFEFCFTTYLCSQISPTPPIQGNRDLFSQQAPELSESSRKFLHYLLLRPHRPIGIAAMRSMPAKTCEGLRTMSSYGNNWLIVPTISPAGTARRLKEMFQASIS